VSAPLQAIVFSSYLLNVLLQLANKNGIQNKKKYRTFVYKIFTYLIIRFICVRGLVAR
jgi:hypothetical protein